jgi:hypothetical protein
MFCDRVLKTVACVALVCKAAYEIIMISSDPLE